jgi:hypothetical protein
MKKQLLPYLVVAAFACGAVVISQSVAGAYPSPGPYASGVHVNVDVGIAAPSNLRAFTDSNACLSDGTVKVVCYKAVQGGGLFLQWVWTAPCGHIQCLNADQFRIVRRSGGSTTTTDRYAALYDPPNNIRGVGLLRGQWSFGDCFTVRGLNLATGTQSADSNMVCVRLIPRPVASVGPARL